MKLEVPGEVTGKCARICMCLCLCMHMRVCKCLRVCFECVSVCVFVCACAFVGLHTHEICIRLASNCSNSTHTKCAQNTYACACWYGLSRAHLCGLLCVCTYVRVHVHVHVSSHSCLHKFLRAGVCVYASSTSPSLP